MLIVTRSSPDINQAKIAFDFSLGALEDFDLRPLESPRSRRSSTMNGQIFIAAEYGCCVSLRLVSDLASIGHIVTYIGIGQVEAEWLTLAEIRLIRQRFQGNTTKEIAKKLSLSHRTIEKHLENIVRKTGSERLSPKNLSLMTRCLEICGFFIRDNSVAMKQISAAPLSTSQGI